MKIKQYLRKGAASEITRQIRTFSRMDRTHAAFLDFLRENIRPGKGLKVLEPACGCGMMTDMARTELSARTEGWDTDPDCLAYAKRAYPRTRFLLQDMTTAPARPDFDLLLFREALMEFPSPAAVLRRCAGFLRRGGWVAALEPDYGATIMHPVVPGWARFLKKYAAFCSEAGDEDFFAGRKLPGAFRAAGLRDLAIRPLMETRSALDRPALREFLETEIMSINADSKLLISRKVFSAPELREIESSLRRVSRAPDAYVQTVMVAVCGRK